MFQFRTSIRAIFAKMDTNYRKKFGYGLLALLSGLVAGGWLGFTLKGGSSSSFSDVLLLTAIFLACSPFLLFSVFTIMRHDQMHGDQMQIFLCVCAGLTFIIASWILARRTGCVQFHIGTFLGALIYNIAAGIGVFGGLSA